MRRVISARYQFPVYCAFLVSGSNIVNSFLYILKRKNYVFVLVEFSFPFPYKASFIFLKKRKKKKSYMQSTWRTVSCCYFKLAPSKSDASTSNR